MGDGSEDAIETREALHKRNNGDLHFRFTGMAKGRQFVVNVQFGSEGDTEALRPEEYDFMIGKIMRLVMQHMGETPNPALH